MDLNKKIKELKPQQLNCNVFDVYSYNGLTMQDLLCQFFTTINECVKSTNEVIDLTEWLVSVGLEEEVVKKLMALIEDGTVEKLINVNLFKTLNNEINGLSSQLEQKANEFDLKLESKSNELERLKATKEEVEIERQRINTIVKNSGTSVNDIELQDIRIDADGEEHDSAGDAVRSQFSNLNSKIIKEYTSSSFWESGAIDGSNGNNIEHSNRLRSVSYIAHNIDKINDLTNGGLAVFAYTSSGNYVGMWNGTDFGDTATWVFNANIKGYRELFPSYEFKIITKGTLDVTKLIITQHSSGDIDEDFKRKGATVDAYKTGKRFKTIEESVSDIKESVDNDLYNAVDITSSLKWRSGSSATNTGNLVLNDDSTKITLPRVMNLGVSTITPKDGYQIYKLISDHEISNGDALSNWTAVGYTSDSYTTKKDEYILIKITATDGSALDVNNITDYISVVQNQNPYQYIDVIINESTKVNTFNEIEFPDYSKISVPNFPNHDITFVDENLWAFDKPSEGGLKVYNSEFSQIGSANTQFYFNKKGGGTAELEMKSVDFNNNNRVLLVGNGSSKYISGDSFLYLFYDAESWLDKDGEINFENCGKYTEIDVSELGDKCYGFWGASCGFNDQIFVSLNMFKDIYLIRLGKGWNNLGSGNMNYIDDSKYNGTYSVLNHWQQKNFITGEYGQHGGQFYKGSLYLVNNDNTKNQIYKCKLNVDGSLQFDVLELGHYSSTRNELYYRYMDGLAIKDGVAYGSPLIVNNNYVESQNKEVLKIDIS